MALRDTLRMVTTPIEAYTRNSAWTGTGFFFSQVIKSASDKSGKKTIWLVTNRHVVLDKDERTGVETLPTQLEFKLRCVDTASQVMWLPISLTNTELHQFTKVSTNPDIDIAVINVSKKMMSTIKANPTLKIPFSSVSEADIPQNNGFDIDICDDAIAIGYPRGYYDTSNLFPIVKSGIIASPWGVKFEKKPRFLVDMKLFPGSSGSLVISKPSCDISIKGQIQTYTDKHFAFLGIYSSEPYRKGIPVSIDDETTIIKHSSYNLGFVWYSAEVIKIINNGVNP